MLAKSHRLTITAILSFFSFSLLLAPLPAKALSINIGSVTINDGREGDNNPTPGIIDFNITPTGTRFLAAGSLTETIVPGVSAVLKLTDLSIRALGADINNNISFHSSLFEAIGPIAKASVHLDGEYTNVLSPHNIGLAGVQLGGFVNNSVIIGVVRPGSVTGIRATHPFNPPDVNSTFDFGVTSLRGSLPFEFGVTGDGINLESATISVVPEPSAMFLLMIGLGAAIRNTIRERAA